MKTPIIVGIPFCRTILHQSNHHKINPEFFIEF
jgi:hypothetical protein